MTAQHSPLLSLPAELRLEIYRPLLSSTHLVIRSLFIRALYDSIFMTQQEKRLCTALLRVCRQITAEALPLLYTGPVWRCGCRTDKLARQVGAGNFARIRRIVVDADDLPEIVRLLDPTAAAETAAPTPRLSFARLEMLEVEGYHVAALNSWGTEKARVEALRLCRLAGRLVEVHPRLGRLLQRGAGGDGGADARDLGLARVRWRFVGGDEDVGGEVDMGDYHAVDLGAIQDVLQRILDVDRASSRASVAPVWVQGGVFRQYPYLPTVVGGSTVGG